MATFQSTLAPLPQAPVWRFQQYQEALLAIAAYEAALRENGSRRRSRGLPVTDQDQREEVFCLFPVRPIHPPLAIVGGMGPLAGAAAFRQACVRFQDSRPVVLYQACSVPDRSTAILGDGGPDYGMRREVALRLAGAVRLAVDLTHSAGGPARCILACNAAHYFWRQVEEALRPCDVQTISLVSSSLEALKPCRKALLLTTEGARAGQVFSGPCRDAGIAFEEPSPALSRLLMRAVYEGMKALDEDRALELGNEFFASILRAGIDFDCILAGCTELPLTIDLLKRRGTPAVAALLSRVRIVDPLEEALCRA